jgi:hypothetical protein
MNVTPARGNAIVAGYVGTDAEKNGFFLGA